MGFVAVAVGMLALICAFLLEGHLQGNFALWVLVQAIMWVSPFALILWGVLDMIRSGRKVSQNARRFAETFEMPKLAMPLGTRWAWTAAIWLGVFFVTLVAGIVATGALPFDGQSESAMEGKQPQKVDLMPDDLGSNLFVTFAMIAWWPISGLIVAYAPPPDRYGDRPWKFSGVVWSAFLIFIVFFLPAMT